MTHEIELEGYYPKILGSPMRIPVSYTHLTLPTKLEV